MELITLKRRKDFLYVRDGRKWVMPSLVLQARAREAEKDTLMDASYVGPRFGFTASKRVGNAVKRNRARRLLKEAVRYICSDNSKQYTQNGCDYVLIARQELLNRDFKDVLSDMQIAFERIHRNKKPKSRKD